jgi:hypothetical protein
MAGSFLPDRLKRAAFARGEWRYLKKTEQTEPSARQQSFKRGFQHLGDHGERLMLLARAFASSVPRFSRLSLVCVAAEARELGTV